MSRHHALRNFIRTAYLSIALLLFAQTVIAIHDGLHANVVQDHCEIAQLLQVSPSSIPAVAPFELPHMVPVPVEVVVPVAVIRVHFRHVQIRAPPAVLV